VPGLRLQADKPDTQTGDHIAETSRGRAVRGRTGNIQATAFESLTVTSLGPPSTKVVEIADEYRATYFKIESCSSRHSKPSELNSRHRNTSPEPGPGQAVTVHRPFRSGRRDCSFDHHHVLETGGNSEDELHDLQMSLAETLHAVPRACKGEDSVP
jgi:hypothetical protein